MSSIGDKDVYPTPELKNSQGEVIAFAGPGMSIWEHVCIEITKGMISSPTFANVDPDDLARAAIEQANELIQQMDEIKKEQSGDPE